MWAIKLQRLISFIFLCESINKYRNTGNKYENRVFRKQTWNEYGANTDEKRIIIGTRRPPESFKKLKQVK
jgi:hypothetical protein